MATSDTKSYLSYLNQLVDEYNSSYHYAIGKRPIDADYSFSGEEIEINSKLPEFKVGDRVIMTKYKNMFSKGYTEIQSK